MREPIRSAARSLALLVAGLLISGAAVGQQSRGSRPSIPVRMVRSTSSPIQIVVTGQQLQASSTTFRSSIATAPAVGTAPTNAQSPAGAFRIPVRNAGAPAASHTAAHRPATTSPPTATRAQPVDLFAGSSNSSPLAGVREYLDQSAGGAVRPAASDGAVDIVLDGGVAVATPGSATASSVHPQSATRSAAVTDGDYRLGPGDVVDVFVWRNAELSRTVPVRPDGYISLPLVGEIVAAGKTAAMLEAEVTSVLGEFIQVPTVTITVTQIRSLVIYVLGRVSKPGPLTLERNVDVVQAIAMAGGVTEFANKNGVHVIRTIRGQRTRIPFPYGDVLKGKEDGIGLVLQAGDVIYVP